MKSLDSVPDDLISSFIVEMLNPKEVSNLASCNSHLRSVLPNLPLRIRITNDKAVLNHTLFVSEFPSGRILQHDDSLRFGQHYRFWRFDSRRGHRCDLISHLPLEGGGFDLAFAAWQRTKYDRCNRRTWTVECGSNNQEGDTVPWGSKVAIMVEGDAEFPAFACHAKRRYLSTYIEEVWEGDEEGEIIEELRWRVLDSPENQKFKILRKDDYDKTRKDNKNLTKIRLKTRATPVFHDREGAFAFYSERSLEGGCMDFGRDQIVVAFSLSTKKGLLHIKTGQLPFEFVVPMTRQGDHTPAYRPLHKEHPLMETLWNINTNYMNPVRCYMATAANCLLWEGDYPNQTLETFSQLQTVAQKGFCDEDGRQFILREDLSMQGKNLKLQKPEFASIPLEGKQNIFFCIFTKPCF